MATMSHASHNSLVMTSRRMLGSRLQNDARRWTASWVARTMDMGPAEPCIQSDHDELVAMPEQLHRCQREVCSQLVGRDSVMPPKQLPQSILVDCSTFNRHGKGLTS